MTRRGAALAAVLGVVMAGCTPAEPASPRVAAPAGAERASAPFIGQTQGPRSWWPSPEGLHLAGHAVVHPSGVVVAHVEGSDLVWLDDGRLFSSSHEGVALHHPATGTVRTGPPVPSLLPASPLLLGTGEHVVWQTEDHVFVRPFAGEAPAFTRPVLEGGLTHVMRFGDGVATRTGNVVVATRRDGTELFRAAPVHDVAASRDGGALLLDRRELRLAPSGAVAHAFQRDAAIEAGGRYVAFGDGDELVVLDTRTGQQRRAPAGGRVHEVAWDDGGKRVGALVGEGQVLVWTLDEPAPRSWATLERARGLSLAADHAFVSSGKETVAIGPAGVVSRAPGQRCQFPGRAPLPMIATCLGSSVVRFDGKLHAEAQRRDASLVALHERRGMLVLGGGDCAGTARVFGVEGERSAPSASLLTEEAWSASTDEHIVVDEGGALRVATATGARGAAYEGLGEPIVGATSDGEGGAIVWGATTVARRGTAGRPSWSQALGGRIVAVLRGGGRVVVGTLPSEQAHEGHVLIVDLRTGATVFDLDEAAPTTIQVLRRRLLVHRARRTRIVDLHTGEEQDDLLLGPVITNGDWAVRGLGTFSDGASSNEGLELRALVGHEAAGRFAEAYDEVAFDASGDRLLVHTRRGQLVVLHVPALEDPVEDVMKISALREVGRVEVPSGFRQPRLVAPGIAAGAVDGAALLVRLDDGRRLWVRGAKVGGACKVTLHDDVHFTGDVDGPVLVGRGGTWLAPRLDGLATVLDRRRTDLLGAFLSPGR